MAHECSNSDCNEKANYYFNLRDETGMSSIPSGEQEGWYCTRHLADQLRKILQRPEFHSTQ